MTEYIQPVCTAAEVLDRARTLAGVITVMTIERDYPHAAKDGRPELEEAYEYLRKEYCSADYSASPRERTILATPLTLWSEANMIDVGWRTEAATVLAWAVGLVETLPPYDVQAKYDAIQRLASLPRCEVSLRRLAELDRVDTEAERWHSRAVRVAGYFEDGSVDALTGARAERRKDMIRRALGTPIQLFGKPYEDLTFYEWSIARSIASERHYAITWLWNGGPWDEVVPET